MLIFIVNTLHSENQDTELQDQDYQMQTLGQHNVDTKLIPCS